MKKSHLKLERSVRRPQGRQQAVAQAAAYRRRDTVPDHIQPSGAQRTPEREWSVTSVTLKRFQYELRRLRDS